MISNKFVKKYMRLAKQVGEDQNPCYSRNIGSVVVRIYENEFGECSGKVLGTGYNGPPKKTPHADSPEYLREMFWPQLTNIEKEMVATAAGWSHKTIDGIEKPIPLFVEDDKQMCDMVCDKFAGSRVCPRKIVGAASGKRLELCPCVHSETNAIVNSSDDLHGAVIFCWCGIPCIECTKLIINSGIKKVYVIDWGGDYSFGSRWLFQKARVQIEEHPPEYYLSD